MKNFLFATLVAATAVTTFSTAALAGIEYGTVRNFDPHRRILVLRENRIYTLPLGVPLPPGIRPGSKVRLNTNPRSLREVRDLLVLPPKRR